MASIQKLPNGRWRARLDRVPGTRHEPTRHFDRRVDAQRWIDENTAAQLSGTWVDPRAGKLTLGVYYEEWADLQVWEVTTRRRFDIAIRQCQLTDTPLAKITPTHGARWVKRMREAKLAATTIEHRIGLLRIVFRAAVRAKKIGEDPFAELALPRRSRTTMIIPTPEEVHRVLEVADPYMELVVSLAAFAGLRIGEVCGLQVDDIGFLTRTLHISRQVQEGLVRLPKHGSERTVHLPDELLELLSRWVGELDPAEPRWLFPGRFAGKPASENTMGTRWRRLRASVLPDLDFRSFRHFYASGLIAAKCDVVTVQHAMGHADPTITLRVYSHLWKGAEDQTRAAAADMMRTVRGSGQDHADAGRTPKIHRASDLRK